MRIVRLIGKNTQSNKLKTENQYLPNKNPTTQRLHRTKIRIT